MKNLWIYNGKLEASPGSSIESTIKEAIELADTVEYHPLLTFVFNDVFVTVAADSNPELIYRDWHRALMGYVEKRVGPYPAAELTADERASDAAKQAAGATITDMAKCLSHEADLEGITGFMYGCAVSMLSQCWEHGDALRRWHNLDTQIGNEGEKANENGGVLNPALLSIG